VFEGDRSVWYDADTPRKGKSAGSGVHKRIFPHVKQLEEDQRDVMMLHALNAKLYSNREAMFFEQEKSMHNNFRPLSTNLENIIQSVISTLVSKIGANRPKATIISRGGDFSVYLKSRQLDRFLWAEFVHHKIHKKLERIFKDACIYGTGYLKIDIDCDEVYCERVHPSEIVVDQRECVSNEMPIQMHQRKLVSKLWLKKTYGKGVKWKERLIDDVQPQEARYRAYTSQGDDQVLVVESWKLATRKGADDGRHTICIENYTLLDEPYKRDRFPFVIMKWEQPETGFYGRSLTGDLVGYQIRLNDLNEVIQIGQDVMCVPRVLIEQGSSVQPAQLDDIIGKGLKYRGTPPEALVWPAFNAEIYSERDRIRASAFEFAGISQLSAQGKLPSQARLDSSEALREYNAIEDTRFNDKTQDHEAAAKEIADCIIELNADLYRGKKSTKRTFRMGNLVQQIDWEEVDMERDMYVLEIGASSIINMTPAARKDTLNSWLTAGIITPDQYKAWSGHEDLERISDTMSAGKDYIEYHIDRMLHGEAMTPDPNMNVGMGFNTMIDTYNHLRTLDTPPNILQLFVNWLLTAKEILQPKQEPAPPMGAMPQDPMAPPMGPEMGMVPPGAPPMGPPQGMGAPMPPPVGMQ
jgi:hypothetical protein